MGVCVYIREQQTDSIVQIMQIDQLGLSSQQHCQEILAYTSQQVQ